MDVDRWPRGETGNQRAVWPLCLQMRPISRLVGSQMGEVLSRARMKWPQDCPHALTLISCSLKLFFFFGKSLIHLSRCLVNKKKILKGLFTLETNTSSFFLTCWHLASLASINQFPMAQPTQGHCLVCFLGLLS